jgi:phosphatidylethanolamine-binding protein (PEBP) family uncharacterized protein
MAQEGGLRLVSHPIAAHGGRLTRQYSAEGQGAKKDMSPPLEWYGVPEGKRSLALLVQDHWRSQGGRQGPWPPPTSQQKIFR